jgi:hypothetical protein
MDDVNFVEVQVLQAKMALVDRISEYLAKNSMRLMDEIRWEQGFGIVEITATGERVYQYTVPNFAASTEEGLLMAKAALTGSEKKRLRRLQLNRKTRSQRLRTLAQLKLPQQYWVQLRSSEWYSVAAGNNIWDVVRYIERTTAGSFYKDQSYITLLMNGQLRVWDSKAKKDVSKTVEEKLWCPRVELE